MKILWIVNTIFPYPAKMIGLEKNVFGGWLNGMANEVIENENVDLAIATVYNGNEIKKISDGKTIYYLIPGAPATKYNKKSEIYWKEINNDFKPDLVHIHGTEYTQGLAFINACSNIKSVVSIQGLVSVYSKYYLANISKKDILKNITFRDIIKRDNIFQAKKKFYLRGINEEKTIKKSGNIIGRTDWDYANCLAINPNMKYFKCNENLRDSFYTGKWDIKNINRYQIFFSQASYPIKGLHILIEALPIIKKKYPNVKVIVAGQNILDNSSIKSTIKRNGYAKYLDNLINKNGVKENIEFVGILNEEQMKEKMLESNVFVQASSIENSPNSLGEAMLLSIPCVASNVGGTSNLLEDKKEGFLYPYTETAMLAHYIMKIFDDDNLASSLGSAAHKHAALTHDKNKNCQELLNIYTDIINNKD